MTQRTLQASTLRFTLLCSLAIPVAGWAVGPAEPGAALSEMQVMDTDGNGKLSAEEHAVGAKKMFDAMDADRDGRVTAVEMTAAQARVTGKKPAAGAMSSRDKIKAVDSNGDGVLSAAEHVAGAAMMFDRMDTDKDGFVTEAELNAGHAKMMAAKPAQ